MIDTIRLNIPIDIDAHSMVTDKCIKMVRTTSDGTQKVLYTKTIIVPPHNATVRVSTYKDDAIFIEFSLPKFWYGHNVYLFNPTDLPEALERIKTLLIKEFSFVRPYEVMKQEYRSLEKSGPRTIPIILPDISLWRIQRLDICYAWQLHSQDEARLALAILKPYEMPRKDQVIYDTTLWYKGNTFSAKFYLKYDEFKQGDYIKLIKEHDGKFAERILRTSEGVLRFEVELRKGKLDTLFKQDLYYTDIVDTAKLQALMRLFLSTITQLPSTTLMNLAKVVRLVTMSSERRKAWELLSFYRLYTSTNPLDQEIIKLLPKATRYSKLKQLKEIGVGIYDQGSELSFSYDIPSLLEVADDGRQDVVSDVMERTASVGVKGAFEALVLPLTPEVAV